EAAFHVGEERRQVRPPRRYFELLRHDELAVITELSVAPVAEQTPRGGLQSNQILIIGGPGQKSLAMGQGAPRIARSELPGHEQLSRRRARRQRPHRTFRQLHGRRGVELQSRKSRANQKCW